MGKGVEKREKVEIFTVLRGKRGGGQKYPNFWEIYTPGY